MDIVYVDIYDLYFDKDIRPIKTKHRFAGAYRAKNFNSHDFEFDFKFTVLVNKGDGYELSISSSNNIRYINLFLHIFEGRNHDIGYIIDYFNNKFSKLDDYNSLNNESNIYGNYLYITDVEKNEIDELISELEENGVTVQQVGYTSSHFERGCSDWWGAYLLGLATNWSSSAIQHSVMKVVNKYKNKFKKEYGSYVVLEYAQIEDKIIDYLCNYAKAEKEELYLYSLESNGDKQVMQWRTRYQIFDVVASESEIISLKTYPIAETHIVKDEIEQSN